MILLNFEQLFCSEVCLRYQSPKRAGFSHVAKNPIVAHGKISHSYLFIYLFCQFCVKEPIQNSSKSSFSVLAPLKIKNTSHEVRLCKVLQEHRVIKNDQSVVTVKHSDGSITMLEYYTE